MVPVAIAYVLAALSFSHGNPAVPLIAILAAFGVGVPILGLMVGWGFVYVARVRISAWEGNAIRYGFPFRTIRLALDSRGVLQAITIDFGPRIVSSTYWLMIDGEGRCQARFQGDFWSLDQIGLLARAMGVRLVESNQVIPYKELRASYPGPCRSC